MTSIGEWIAIGLYPFIGYHILHRAASEYSNHGKMEIRGSAE